ncbi:MAG TPA: amino acid permease [Candidatus Omnitrophota bacterium]|nr:amino acid permease [Candidatus Omnitrophota bacterium]
MFDKKSVAGNVRRMIVGGKKNPLDKNIFHQISLIAFFAWIGLGVDGLSSSCYGPEEAYLALGGHSYLSILVGLMTVATIFVISSGYSQIIEKFPSGGGGYVVASKLLSPMIGMICGSALLIDYVLTITLSIASGADALFSFLPAEFSQYKLVVALAGVVLLTVLNMRGVKESVVPLIPIFLIFILMHFFVIVYSLITHMGQMHVVAASVSRDVSESFSQVGLAGVLALLMRAYSLGAGTYTGIEAVSNGLPILRAPQVETGKKTMWYMSISLSFMVFGLMIAYLLYGVAHVPGKTLNAVLFEKMVGSWGYAGIVFLFVILISEALILLIAAQTGFLGGPRVLANMAVDRWFPTKFSSLSDRLVTQNGILLMGAAAFITMYLSKGSVKFMVILYSINVFITFCLSQLGMVRHWWINRGEKWKRKIIVNGVGFLLCLFILTSVVIIKFNDGGWITILVTGLLAAFAVWIRKHYLYTLRQLRRLNSLMEAAKLSIDQMLPENKTKFDPKAKTAVVFVNGYNGLGLHSLFNVVKLFGDEFKNYVFVQIGVLDAGNFKGAEELDNLKSGIEKEVAQYVEFMRCQGKHAEGMTFIGVDVLSELEKVGPIIIGKYPNSIFFGGQLVFLKNTIIDKWLHNYTVFAMQQQFYQEGIPFIILPIRV